MRVEGLSVQLRARPMTEAADLGVRLVQTHARDVWLTCTPVFLVVMVAALSTVELAPWAPAVIVFWFKPWLDRSVLFVLSRAVFGQRTQFADLWRSRSTVWGEGWWRSFSWSRLSPWRSFTQPIDQLEGVSRKEQVERRTQLLRGQRVMASWLQFVFGNLEASLVYGGCVLVQLMVPPEQSQNVMDWFFGGDAGWQAALALSVLDCAAVLLLEPFFVGAGFSMYLNRRVELEAWDIEQEFRRAFA